MRVCVRACVFVIVSANQMSSSFPCAHSPLFYFRTSIMQIYYFYVLSLTHSLSRSLSLYPHSITLNRVRIFMRLSIALSPPLSRSFVRSPSLNLFSFFPDSIYLIENL